MIGIIILSIIQGIAEFLPISSSAHLIIFRDVFNVGSAITPDLALSFDIALHFGTFFAILVYFFKDFLNMFIKGVTKGIKDPDGKMMYFIIIATIPAALVGILFEDIIENIIRGNLYVIAFALAIMGIIIYLVDKSFKNEKTVSEMTLTNALLIGVSQAFALIPGFSRSGTTIATGRIMKLKREEAAKFSFYLSAPVTLGAVTMQLLESNTINIIMDNILMFSVGIIGSFITGLICIGFLLKYLRKNDFKIFMWYRIALAITVILMII